MLKAAVPGYSTFPEKTTTLINAANAADESRLDFDEFIRMASLPGPQQSLPLARRATPRVVPACNHAQCRWRQFRHASVHSCATRAAQAHAEALNRQHQPRWAAACPIGTEAVPRSRSVMTAASRGSAAKGSVAQSL